MCEEEIHQMVHACEGRVCSRRSVDSNELQPAEWRLRSGWCGAFSLLFKERTRLKIPPFDGLSSSLSDLGVEDRVVSEVEPPKAG